MNEKKVNDVNEHNKRIELNKILMWTVNRIDEFIQ